VGTLRQFEPDAFGCNVFFETGTGMGFSLLKALAASCFEKLYSVEIAPDTYEYAAQMYGVFKRLSLINSDSPSALREVLPTLQAEDRVLFFLDAHFPGELSSSFPGYKADILQESRLPLEAELSVIAELRRNSHDVIVADDLRIYENGPFAHGNMPEWAETLPPERKNIDFVMRIFPGARIERDYRSEGYLLIYT
jgi:hypothetical protein